MYQTELEDIMYVFKKCIKTSKKKNTPFYLKLKVNLASQKFKRHMSLFIRDA